MRRLVAVITAAAFMSATPVFAQTPAPTNAPQSLHPGDQQSNTESVFQKDSLLLDGQDANAQQDPNQQDPNNNLFGDIPTGVVVAVGAGGVAGLIYAISRNHSSNNSVSP